MYKRSVLLMLALCLLVAAAPAVSAQSGTDLIILLDSSQSMIPYYNDVVDFICKNVIPSYLRYGDRFHVLTFSDSVQNPVSQEVLTNSDVNSIVAGLLLLYPLGTSTDLVTALDYTWKWSLELPSGSEKVIIMITDGMHAPSSSSPYATIGTEEVKQEITRAAEQIKSQNWVFKLITVPFSDTAAATQEKSSSPGAGIYTETIAEALNTEAIEYQKGSENAMLGTALRVLQLSCPPNLPKKNFVFKLPMTFANQTDEDIQFEIVKVIANGKTNVLNGKAFGTVSSKSSKTISVPLAFPPDWPSGEQRISLEPVFSDSLRSVPPSVETNVVLKYSFIAGILGNITQTILLIVAIVALVALVVFVLMYVRSIHKQAEKPVVEAVYDSMQAERRAELQASSPDTRKAAALADFSGRPPRQAQSQSAQSKAAPSAMARTEIDTQQDVSARRMAAIASTTASAKPSNLPALRSETESAGERRQTSLSSNTSSGLDVQSVLSSYAGKQKAMNAQLLNPLEKAERAYIAPGQHKKPVAFAPSIVKPGTVKVEFIVEQQNRCIGKRNIKMLHAGGKKTIGGNLSDFYIFLFAFPNRIADVYYDGTSITIVPQKTEYFPDYDGTINVQFDEAVRIVSRYGREAFFRFSMYIPPEEKINKILHCVELPGKQN